MRPLSFSEVASIPNQRGGSAPPFDSIRAEELDAFWKSGFRWAELKTSGNLSHGQEKTAYERVAKKYAERLAMDGGAALNV